MFCRSTYKYLENHDKLRRNNTWQIDRMLKYTLRLAIKYRVFQFKFRKYIVLQFIKSVFLKGTHCSVYRVRKLQS